MTLLLAALIPAFGVSAVEAGEPPCLSATEAAPPGTGVGAGPVASPVEAWVRAAVAHRWSVAPACVRLEWPAVPPPGEVDEGSLSLEGSGHAGRWTVAFEVEGRRRRLPLSARVEVLLPVAVRPLPRSVTVGEADVELRPALQAGPGDAPVDPVGWVTARPVEAGGVLVPPTVRPPTAVRAGDPVEVRWEGGVVQARGTGTALRTGAVGDTVDVRVGSGLRRRARILGEGTVELLGSASAGRKDR